MVVHADIWIRYETHGQQICMNTARGGSVNALINKHGPELFRDVLQPAYRGESPALAI